jgi:cytochrome P450
MSPRYEGSVLESLFSTRDPEYHKAMKVPVAQKFSMTSIRTFEPYADECSDIFINTMRELAGQRIDLGVWLQWYAFDVIGAITFQRRFGFMEQRKDVDDMIKGIDAILTYAGVVGEIPQWHPWLLANEKIMSFLDRTFNLPNPIPKIMKITEEQIALYDEEEKTGDRGDFLAWLRAEQAKNGNRMSRRDIMNHLSNNLYLPT